VVRGKGKFTKGTAKGGRAAGQQYMLRVSGPRPDHLNSGRPPLVEKPRVGKGKAFGTKVNKITAYNSLKIYKTLEKSRWGEVAAKGQQGG